MCPTRRPGALVQFWQLLARNVKGQWRDPGHTLSRYFITLMMGFIIGTVEFGKAREDHLVDARTIQNAMGAMYMLTISMAFEAAYEAQSGMGEERVVYFRESAARTYGPGPYLAAQALAEAPFLLPQAAAYTLLLYFLLGMGASLAGVAFAYLVVLTSAAAMILLAQALVHITPAPYLASLGLSVIGGSLFNLMCGFLAPAPTLPPWWQWFYYTNPLAYALYAITANQLGDVARPVPDPLKDGATLPVSEFVAQVFGIRRSGAFPGEWGAVGMLGALGAAYFAASYCGLRFMRHQKR